MTGRLCALIGILIPAYMVVVMSGFRRALEVLPQVLACAVTFAVVLFAVTNTMGPALAVILASIAAMIAMVTGHEDLAPGRAVPPRGRRRGDDAVAHTTRPASWCPRGPPYMLLVGFVLAWRYPPIQGLLNSLGTTIPVPLLHDVVTRVPPLTPEPSPYAAVYNFNCCPRPARRASSPRSRRPWSPACLPGSSSASWGRCSSSCRSRC